MAEMEGETSTMKYDHQGLIEEIDRLNQELEAMKETMISSSVRAHILEAEIASLFDPEVEEELRKVTEAAESCQKAIKPTDD